jgi:hypothetical protein
MSNIDSNISVSPFSLIPDKQYTIMTHGGDVQSVIRERLIDMKIIKKLV